MSAFTPHPAESLPPEQASHPGHPPAQTGTQTVVAADANHASPAPSTPSAQNAQLTPPVLQSEHASQTAAGPLSSGAPIAPIPKTRLNAQLMRLKTVLPVGFFIGGFAWDALTIGHRVMLTDIAIFSGYLGMAGWILHQLSTPATWWARAMAWLNASAWIAKKLTQWPVQDWPYWVLQFLFGSLLSALFILYFKSSSYGMAWMITLLLGVLLVANEFLESEYRRLTLCWTMFGLCTMLLFNFALPYLLGSVHPVWFYTSTLLGALASFLLYRHAPKHSGSIWPVGLLALMLMGAYRADMIPPVPLVKQAVVVGYAIEKSPAGYWITLQKAPWWQFWRVDSAHLRITPTDKLVCFSAVFAPKGLHTRLIHHWQKREKGQWVDYGAPGFALAGGRDGGYRGYTYKTRLTSGEWRVRIQTEALQTVAVHAFTVTVADDAEMHRIRVRY